MMCAVMVSGQAVAPRPQGATASTATRPAGSPDASTYRAVIDKYCVTCHSGKQPSGNLSLAQLDLARLGDNAAIGEKIVRKLRAGLMPPTNMARPDSATRESLITWMESELDRA